MKAKEVLRFWFGELDDDGLPAKEVAKRWWRKNPAFDTEIRARFSHIFRACLDESIGWPDDPRGKLARVIVLDQFSRNAFRGQPEMYAGDGRARELAYALLESGELKMLEVSERAFALMPLMHSESIADQKRCEQEFEAMVREFSGTGAQGAVENYLDFAERHREIIERFGRFPHRNEILGRQSTPAELEFLDTPGSSF